MSMLSAQCDELRKAAQTCRDLGRYETEQMLLDAADTILSLRDKAQALQAENAKLRELVKSMYYDLINMTFPPDWVTDYAADMRELELDVDE